MQTENEQGLLRRSDALTLDEVQSCSEIAGKVVSAEDFKIEYYHLSETAHAIRFGKMCFVCFSGFTINDSVILRLPSDIAPYKQIFTMMQHRQSNNYFMAIVSFSVDGSVQAWQQTVNSEVAITRGALYGTVCYICR